MQPSYQLQENDWRGLLTASPSRLIFPRGFLWDDGFHNLIICHVNADLCQQIVRNWLEVMDIFGWIPREQIRGEQIREPVPKKFQLQNIIEANPPTILLPVLYLIETQKLRGERAEFLNQIYPLLQKYFRWLYST